MVVVVRCCLSVVGFEVVVFVLLCVCPLVVVCRLFFVVYVFGGCCVVCVV